MRTLLLLVTATALSLGVIQGAELRLVSTVWSPFTNEPGRPRFALDLVEAALGRFNVTAKTSMIEPPRFTAALLSSEFDGSAAAWKDPEREKALLFSQPYLENRLVLVGRRGEDVSAASLAGLKGKRVAVVEGYSYGEGVETAGMSLVRSIGEEDSLSKLLNGSADYALMDELVVQFMVTNYPKEAASRLQLGTTPLVTRQLYLAVRRSRPDADSIISRFNAQLRGMISDRTYHRLLHVSWIRADVDGDGVAEYVPASDLSGAAEPSRAYSLFATPSPGPPAPETTGRRFYVGGNIYSDWAAVPSRYKVDDPNWPDARRSTASIFQFRW